MPTVETEPHAAETGDRTFLAAPETCDLAMKGGITSGVIYPQAVLALARRYRFRNIGGTSAGAIAAAWITPLDQRKQTMRRTARPSSASTVTK